jgi:hypothetical protein
MAARKKKVEPRRDPANFTAAEARLFEAIATGKPPAHPWGDGAFQSLVYKGLVMARATTGRPWEFMLTGKGERLWGIVRQVIRAAEGRRGRR